MACLAVAACGEVKSSNPDAANPPGDGVAMFDAVHVRAADERGSTVDLILNGSTPLDTTNLTVGGPGVDFVAVPQDVSGAPEIALLRVRSLQVIAGTTVLVRGTRPLVVLAEEITIAGGLDVGGKQGTPGAGAGMSGVGGMGTIDATNNTGSGGGGGGFAGRGGNGGASANLPPGTGGISNGDAALTALVGGSPGGVTGTAAQCQASLSGGAAGGAIQLSASKKLTIDGAINAGGGGGGSCGQLGTVGGAGNGGGSGGAIYLQSPMIAGAGRVSANGGGGGGGSSTTGAQGQVGTDAIDLSAGRGGTPGGNGGRGGDGGTNTDGAAGGVAQNNASGGGGGGAAGRIVVKGTLPMSLQIVPTPSVVP